MSARSPGRGARGRLQNDEQWLSTINDKSIYACSLQGKPRSCSRLQLAGGRWQATPGAVQQEWQQEINVVQVGEGEGSLIGSTTTGTLVVH